MSQFIYYHNPRCSKSRQGLAILEENKVDFRIKEYLKEPLKQTELKELAAKLENGTLPLRKGEAVYKEMKLGKLELTLHKLCKIVVENPILLERPILAGPKKAIVGRPPEDLLKVI